MDRLKIFWLGRDDSTRMTSQAFYLRKELSGRTDVTTVWDVSKERHPHAERDVRVHLDRLDEKPDLIYIGAPHIFWEHLDKIDIPKFYWWSDPHSHPNQTVEWFNKSKINIALHGCFGNPETNQRGMTKFIDHLWDGHKSAFFPHGVDTNVFKNYGLEKEQDFLIFGRGRGTNWYPLRNAMTDWIRNSGYTYKEIGRPKRDYGWTPERLEAHGFYAWESYARLLNKTRIIATGTSTQNYLVNKLLEAMACKAYLICNAPKPAHYYHFYWFMYSEMNMSEYLKDHMDWTVNYYLNDHPEVMEWKIDNAYKVVREYHSIERRVDKLLEYYEGLDEDGNRLWY